MTTGKKRNNIEIYGQLVYNHPLCATHEPTYPSTYWDNIQLIQKEYIGNSDLMFCHNDTDNGKGILVIGKYADDK